MIQGPGVRKHMSRFVISTVVNVELAFFFAFYADAYTSQVGCRLIQLLIETAYIQPPVDQLGDGPPDIRPAFMHSLRTVTKDAQ